MVFMQFERSTQEKIAGDLYNGYIIPKKSYYTSMQMLLGKSTFILRFIKARKAHSLAKVSNRCTSLRKHDVSDM